MKKLVIALIGIAVLIVVVIILFPPFGTWQFVNEASRTELESRSALKTAIDSNSYLACGCGCCGGTTPNEVCLYNSKGDTFDKIISDDFAIKDSPQCATMGCSLGTLYKYCD